jgi:hypothetical protein
MLFKKFHLQQLVSPRHRVHIEWRLPISGVHPSMMEKSALADEGGGCTPTPFQPITIMYKVEVYATAERASRYTPSISSLSYMYSVVLAFPSLALKYLTCTVALASVYHN